MSSFWGPSLASVERAFVHKFLVVQKALLEVGGGAGRHSRSKPSIWDRDWFKEAKDFTTSLVFIGITAYTASKLVSILEGALKMGNDRDGLMAAKKSLAKRLNRPEIEAMTFDSYEMRLMVDVLGPDELEVTFADVGGLESQLEDVKDNVVLPIRLWAQDRHRMVGVSPCPTGVILYGKPGTGKSLIAKAIAKECNATFINIKASSLLDKWLGESDKLATALFRLARKLSPAIIFIDEVETLLRKRGGNSGAENQAVVSMQGVFLSEWDGLQTPDPTIGNGPVLLLGATNRLDDIDSAFQRRFPVKIATTMPDTKQRASILQALLKKELIDSTVNLMQIAECTEGRSGSDLRELVRLASLNRTKEVRAELAQSLAAMTSSVVVAKKTTSVTTSASTQEVKAPAPLRALNNKDFQAALRKQRTSAQEAAQFNKKQRKEDDERLALALEKFFSNAVDQQQQPEQEEVKPEEKTDTGATGASDQYQDALQHEVE
jgi:ATP-dependent 26S proteasome regulatory subunit